MTCRSLVGRGAEGAWQGEELQGWAWWAFPNLFVYSML